MRKTIEEIIKENQVVVIMKGTRKNPQCGFSRFMIKILEQYPIQIKDVNVLAEEGLREKVRAISNWPTVPQFFVNEQFIGGNDILREMH